MRVLTSLIVTSLLLTGTAFAQDAAPKVDDSTAWFQSSTVLTQKTGEGIYKAVCASCHMPKGEGAVGAGHYPALANNETLEFAEYPVFMVTKGGGAMPALGTVLDDEQIAAVVNYIRTSFGNSYTEDPATPEMAADAR